MNLVRTHTPRLLRREGIRDFGSSLSAMELHLCFLDLPLHQLVKGSDVRELLDPSSDLAVLNSCSKIRRINLIVRVISSYGRSRSGSPQVCNGPVDSSLPNFRFVY